MIKNILTMTAFLALISSSAYAEEITRGIESANIQVERLLAPQVALSTAGVYRIDDKATGYHIYVITTGQPNTVPEIQVVPFKDKK